MKTVRAQILRAILVSLGSLVLPEIGQAFGLSFEPAYHLETVRRDGATWDLYEGMGFIGSIYFPINPDWSVSADLGQGATKSNYSDIVPNSESFFDAGLTFRLAIGNEKRVFMGFGGFCEKSNQFSNAFGLAVTGEIKIIKIQSFFVPLTGTFHYRFGSPAKRVMTVGTGFGVQF